MKWFLWHGDVFRALTTVDGPIGDLEILQPDDEREPGKLLTAVHEFDSYLRANAGRIPNFGERHRAGEAISTAFTEADGYTHIRGIPLPTGDDSADKLERLAWVKSS